MKRVILIGILVCLIGIVMEQTYHLYGMKITVTGDDRTARGRAYLARLLMFQTKLINVNRLDIIQNVRRLSDGTIIHVMSQHGFDSAHIHVPRKPIPKPPEYEEKPMFEVIPFIAIGGTTEEWDKKGLLVCHGGYDFGGWYELFSPYGDDMTDFHYNTPWGIRAYTPYEYEKPDGEMEVIEWQVNDFYDSTRLVEREYDHHVEKFPVYWDEYPWMSTGSYYWDPVFYESYDEFLSGKTKPHTIGEIGRTFIRSDPSGEYPGFWVYTLSVTYGVSTGEVLGTISGQQRVEGVLTEASDDYWYKTEELFHILRYCIDQENPTKHAIIYYTMDLTAECSGEDFRGESGSTMHFINSMFNVYTNQRLRFKGLGHEFDIPGWEQEAGAVDMRLYKVKDKYVCLFTRHSPTMKIVGAAVEGGDYYITDLSEGVKFGEEVKDVFPRSTSTVPTIGLLKRIEPTKRIKKEQ